MKTLKTMVAGIMVMFLTVHAVAQTSEDRRIIKDAETAKAKLKNYEGLDEFFSKSAGYVIFPNVGKGGLIVGAASGNGVVYEKGAVVGMADLKKLSVGMQAGGQAFTEIIFFETKADLDEFKGENYEFSAELSAVALKSGKALNAKYKEGVAVFALPKAGLMADATVGGQKFSYEAF